MAREGDRSSFWSGGGWRVRGSHSFLPLRHDRVPFLHRHGGVLGEHLWPFAAPPREKAQEVLFAHALGTSWSVCLGLAAFNHAGEFAHLVS